MQVLNDPISATAVVAHPERWIGTQCVVEGCIVILDPRCWIIEANADPDTLDESKAILIQHPGLAYLLLPWSSQKAPHHVKHVWIAGWIEQNTIGASSVRMVDVTALQGFHRGERWPVEIDVVDVETRTISKLVEALDRDGTRSEEEKRMLIEDVRKSTRAW